MRMTDLQFQGMTINLSTLGQVDLSDNDPAVLLALAELLSAAAKNVTRAMAAQYAAPDDPPAFANPSDDPRAG